MGTRTTKEHYFISSVNESCKGWHYSVKFTEQRFPLASQNMLANVCDFKKQKSTFKKAWQNIYRVWLKWNKREMSTNVSHTKVGHKRSVALTSSNNGLDHRARLGPTRTYLKKSIRSTLQALLLSSCPPSASHRANGAFHSVLSLMTAVSLSLSEHAAFQQNLKRNWKGRGWNTLFKNTQPDLLPGDPSTTFQPAESKNHLTLN